MRRGVGILGMVRLLGVRYPIIPFCRKKKVRRVSALSALMVRGIGSIGCSSMGSLQIVFQSGDLNRVLVQALRCADCVDVFVKPVIVDIMNVLCLFDYLAITKVTRDVVKIAHNLC